MRRHWFLLLSVAVFVTAALTKAALLVGLPTTAGPHTAPNAPTRTGPATPQVAVEKAAAAGRARGARVAVAVEDRQTGTVYPAGDVDVAYSSASLVKVFVATRLLVDGQASDPAVRALMFKMIVASDDAAATQLYPVAGAEGLASWIARRYQVSGLAATPEPGSWGLTRITARAMVTFYAAVAKDPLVGPWLLDAMAKTEARGSDGWAQWFGIPQATDGWRVKQGWICCVDSKASMHSTGFVNDDRYTVALLTEGSKDLYGDKGATTLTLMAKALMPDGSVA